MRIAGVIIAGGKSSRMGEEKALAMMQGRPLLFHVIDRIAPQVQTVILNANGDPARFNPFGLTVIPDLRLDVGTPLAGLHAALHWANDHGFDAALTVPSDAPFLPRDLAAMLTGERTSVAASGGQTHYLTGFWPTDLLRMLENLLRGNHHSRESEDPALAIKAHGAPACAGVAERKKLRVQDWAAKCKARVVEWPVEPFDPFINVNTPADLAKASRLAAELAP